MTLDLTKPLRRLADKALTKVLHHDDRGALVEFNSPVSGPAHREWNEREFLERYFENIPEPPPKLRRLWGNIYAADSIVSHESAEGARLSACRNAVHVAVEFIEWAPIEALIRKALCEFKAGRELESVAALAALLPEKNP